MAVVAWGAVYFAIVFAVGFVLGVVRELILSPTLGVVHATLIEAPVMLTASYVTARALVAKQPGLTAVGRIIMGMVALALLLSAEVMLGMFLRGYSLADWLAHVTTPQGQISMVLFAAFALMPLCIRMRQKDVSSKD